MANLVYYFRISSGRDLLKEKLKRVTIFPKETRRGQLERITCLWMHRQKSKLKRSNNIKSRSPQKRRPHEGELWVTKHVKQEQREAVTGLGDHHHSLSSIPRVKTKQWRVPHREVLHPDLFLGSSPRSWEEKGNKWRSLQWWWLRSRAGVMCVERAWCWDQILIPARAIPALNC